MIEDPCEDCTRKEEDDYGLVCSFWCTSALEYTYYMIGYKDGLHELKTMDGDGSSHTVCLECGFCKTCKDCKCGIKK